MDYPRCKTCKHFEKVPIMGSVTRYDTCANSKFLAKGMLKEADGLRVFPDDPYTGLWIEVGPDFGCIQHEGK